MKRDRVLVQAVAKKQVNSSLRSRHLEERLVVLAALSAWSCLRLMRTALPLKQGGTARILSSPLTMGAGIFLLFLKKPDFSSSLLSLPPRFLQRYIKINCLVLSDIIPQYNTAVSYRLTLIYLQYYSLAYKINFHIMHICLETVGYYIRSD